jgi:hypothetical protein
MQTRFDKRRRCFPATVDKDQYHADTATAKIDLENAVVALKGKAAATGDTSDLQGIADERMAVLTAQADNLKKQVRKFRKIGDSDTANAIQAQIDGIRLSVKEIAKAKLQTVIDGINTAAGIREAGFGIADRVAAIFGRKGDLNKIADDRIKSMQDQIGGLQQALLSPDLGEDQKAAIEQQIKDLSTSIDELPSRRFRTTLMLSMLKHQRRKPCSASENVCQPVW